MSLSPEKGRKAPLISMGGRPRGTKFPAHIPSAPALPCSGNALGRVFSPAELQPLGHSHNPFHLADEYRGRERVQVTPLERNLRLLGQAGLHACSLCHLVTPQSPQLWESFPRPRKDHCSMFWGSRALCDTNMVCRVNA